MRSRWTIPAAVSLLLLWLPAGVWGQAPGARKGHQRSVEKYVIPDVTLLSQDRENLRLQDFLAGDKPVLVNFIYATCTTICPVLSVGYHHLQGKLGPESEKARLVSISIDPENDTPEAMKEFLTRYQARKGWYFLTGSREDINNVMRAFDAFIPDKMSHRPLSFLRSPRDGTWVRIDGLIGTQDLLKEYRALQ